MTQKSELPPARAGGSVLRLSALLRGREQGVYAFRGELVPLGVRLFVLFQESQVVLLLGDRLTIQIEVVKSEPVAGAVEVLVQDEAVLGR